jgi:integrase
MLATLLDSYRMDRGIRACTFDRMRRSVTLFSEFLGHDAVTGDLNRDNVNRWIAWLLERFSAKSAREYRGDLVALWRYAASLDLCDYPARIRIVRLPCPIPVAWTPDEVRRMLFACLLVPHGEYLKTLLSAAYQTGLRASDLFSLESHQIAPDGTVRIVQHKSGRGIVCQLDADTADAVRSRGGLNPPVGRRRVYRLIERARKFANVPAGALQQMRRTGATQVEITQPGAAMRYLGHSTPGLAYRYYVDASQLCRPVCPPRIE